ncbi:MAG: rhomboid family intramembrane serine protease [Candidatus Thermoplasmatota archaeon]|nr:rhomboid family intramembrane serine protease [Candidatus Thermoplasmatota archaeon]
MNTTDLFAVITVIEIIIIILFVFILPRMKKAMVSMILAMGIMAVFITHVILDSRILGGEVPFFGGASENFRLPLLWGQLGFRVSDVLEGRELYTLVTALFVHADILHLIMNLLVLLLLGVPLEQKIGARNFAILFFAAGIGAGLIKLLLVAPFGDINSGLNTIINPNSTGIGASGAIFGVLGAFVALYPKEKVIFPLILIRPWPVFIIALIYGGSETIMVLRGVEDGVGHLTHFNGLIVGVGVALMMKKMKMIAGKRKWKKSDKNLVSELGKMAVSDNDKKTVRKIEKADLPEIRVAWVEHFLENAACPRCGTGFEAVDKNECDCGYVSLGDWKMKDH